MGGQGTKWRRNTGENLNRLSRVHERYRRQTDRRTGDDFAKIMSRSFFLLFITMHAFDRRSYGQTDINSKTVRLHSQSQG